MDPDNGLCLVVLFSSGVCLGTLMAWACPVEWLVVAWSPCLDQSLTPITVIMEGEGFLPPDEVMWRTGRPRRPKDWGQCEI